MTDDDAAAPMTALLGLPALLYRQGHGEDLWALSARPRVADLGCGTGASARVLARVLGVIVDCIDSATAFLDRLRERPRGPRDGWKARKSGRHRAEAAPC